MVIQRPLQQGVRLILHPNRSATWPQARACALILAACSLSVAGLWFMMGAWMVLPFAGMESALIWLLMYKVNRATYRQQLIDIDPTHILIQKGTFVPETEYRLAREDCYVLVEESGHKDAPLIICLGNTKGLIRIGDFLNVQDSKKALRLLEKAGLSIRARYKTACMAL